MGPSVSAGFPDRSNGDVEGAEIPVSDLITVEVDVLTKEVAGLSVVTSDSELVEDSSPEALLRSGPAWPATAPAGASSRVAIRA